MTNARISPELAEKCRRHRESKPPAVQGGLLQRRLLAYIFERGGVRVRMSPTYLADTRFKGYHSRNSITCALKGLVIRGLLVREEGNVYTLPDKWTSSARGLSV